MEQKRVLVVEDDAAIRQGIVDALRFAGYEVLQAANGNDGMKQALQASIDLLMLDLILPGPSGFEILQATRQTRATLPIIILTARGEEGDRVHGLRLGADDYVVKPFSVRELLARVEAVLRRAPERSAGNGRWTFTGGAVDFGNHEVRRDDGEREELSEREVELLRYLASKAGHAVTR